jgi:hypothetical protein
MIDVDPRYCSTGDPDKGGNCRECVEYRRLRAQSREARR